MKNFKSFLAKELQEYAAYRKGLGYAKKAIRHPLLTFDQYLEKHNTNWKDLNPAFFLQLRANICNHPNSTNQIISNLRGFFDFLVRQGTCADNPLKDIPFLSERYYVPFVFSPEQTDHLLKAICKNIRKAEKHFLYDTAHYLAITMLARCGMRINEPLRLQMHHYRLDEGTVYIEKTKFRKDRLIPVPNNVSKLIQNYLAARSVLCPDDQNPYLFAGRKSKPLMEWRVRTIFLKAIEEIGLKCSKKMMGDITFGSPTPHSLRHSFAINTLNKIKEWGKSPQQALPILSTYMGHRKYQYTGAYLKVKNATDVAGLIEFTKSQLCVI
ncbi:tyrosine-type recombinase/integrase [Desulfobacterales bacterium HSG17]|nr:tyrosine-type recombinase/integrase [Desulfobacterales bacterium HSG17]